MVGSSAGEPDFASRLSEAIARRGLSLARIKAHLGQVGLEVSVATLSYWTTGRSRPARSRSLDVVRELEAILAVEEGWLVEAMVRGPRSYDLSQVLGVDALAPAEIKEYELPPASQWQQLVSHRRIIVDERGHEARFESENLVMARQDGARQWSVVLQQIGGARATPDVGGVSHLESAVDLGDGISAYVFALDEPLARGQIALTSHAFDVVDPQDRLNETGIAVEQQIGHLIIELVFLGERPASITRWHRRPGEQEDLLVDIPLVMSGNCAQCVIPQAAAGLHLLRVTW